MKPAAKVNIFLVETIRIWNNSASTCMIESNNTLDLKDNNSVP